MIKEVIIAILASIFILEGLVVTISPKWVKSISRKIFKNSDLIRAIGIIEVLLGILILILAFS